VVHVHVAVVSDIGHGANGDLSLIWNLSCWQGWQPFAMSGFESSGLFKIIAGHLVQTILILLQDPLC